ncbi:DUF7601 domain-containing protein [Faecalibacterium prausnitzii]|uniref:DUF7601 domain-containing protein n=1 Tax=Faecalibacterium prausnitzii TaxID=853 RepID=A0A291TBR7_9FIRM|nr:hypothetical protein [Faecalibacterium prausnitzii]ATL90538.1 hypothetical protein CRH10_09635 [Faecalibacterium prausnitzii]
MRKNHHGKKDRLVKRVFALCLALAVICTCLVPVFATEYKEVVDSGEEEIAGFGGDFPAVDDGELREVYDESEAAYPDEREVVDYSGGNEATRPVEGGEDNLDGGPNVKETEWGTVIEYDTSTSTSTDPSSSTVTQWSGEDDVVEKPDDKVVVSGDEIKKLQDMVVYRFWLKELNANDLQDITAQAQINNMTESEYLARNGEVLWNLYFIQAVPRAETIADYSSYIENPSSNRDPKGELRQFDYWYTLDEFGNRVRLNLTDPTSNILDDKTTTVNVYAAWKDGTVGSDEEEDVDHEDLVDKNPVPVDLETKAAASYKDEDGSTQKVDLPVEVKNLPSAAHSLSVIHMGDDDMQTFYESHSNDFEGMAPILGLKISPKNAKGEKVQPAKGEKATVTVSGLEKLPEMEGATADTLKVLHETSDGNVEILDVLTYTNGTLTFETSSFSPFVVVRTDGYAVDTLDINSITKVSIKDDIANSGHYILQITADGKDYEGEKAGKLLKDNGFTVTWQRAGTVVDRIEKTNGVYSREENGGWVDVVYTDGANKTYTVIVNKDGQSQRANSTVNYNDELQNYSFEDVKSSGTSALSDNSNNTNPSMAWKTTASDHKIEVGNTTAQSDNTEYQYENNKWVKKTLTQTEYSYGCSSAVSGDQFAELNANGVGALYQDVLTMPGQDMNWQFYHKARTRISSGAQNNNVITTGSDKMAMVIAPVELVENVTTHEQLQTLLNKCAVKNGPNIVQGDGTMGVSGKSYTVYVCESTSNIQNKSGYRSTWYGGSSYVNYSTSSWQKIEGKYTVPNGQYLTRFFFAAIDTASNGFGHSVGNLLDDVWFSQSVAPPTSGTGHVTVTKKFYGLTEDEARTVVRNTGFITYGQGTASAALTAVDFSGENLVRGTDDNGASYISVSYVIKVPNVAANTDYTYHFVENTSKAQVDGYHLKPTLVDDEIGTSGSVTMNKEHSNPSITFSNFYEKNTADVTLTKHVTGLMGDTHKEFAFSITGLDDSNEMLENGDLSNFTLTHNGNVTLKNVPMGTVFAVVETLNADSGYATKATGHDTFVTDARRTFYYKLVLKDGKQVLVACDANGNNEMEQEGLAITVTNHCTLQPDLGVLLDTLPYIVILAVVAGGVALLMLRKRRKEDD